LRLPSVWKSNCLFIIIIVYCHCHHSLNISIAHHHCSLYIVSDCLENKLSELVLLTLSIVDLFKVSCASSDITTTTTHTTLALSHSCKAIKHLFSLLNYRSGQFLVISCSKGSSTQGNLIPSLQPIVRPCQGTTTRLNLSSCTLLSAYF
jgi:hypothetical protein